MLSGGGLNDWDRGVGDGKVELLKRLMVKEDKREIPDLDTLVHWADDIMLPTTMIDPILVAAGYEGWNLNVEHPILIRRNREVFIRAMREIRDHHSYSAPVGLAIIGASILRGAISSVFRRNRHE